jgi:hypothetical protein
MFKHRYTEHGCEELFTFPYILSDAERFKTQEDALTESMGQFIDFSWSFDLRLAFIYRSLRKLSVII